MTSLGFKVDSTSARYAIVDEADGKFSLLNGDTESRLLFPADLDCTSEKLAWLHSEIERVFRENGGIKNVVVKTKEFGLRETKAMRESSHLEAAIILFCAQNQISVEMKGYNSLGTKSSKAMEHAESRVGRTSKYWDKNMADAVIAGWHGTDSA